MSRREDVDFHPNLPSMLNSTRLAEGNWWNPICLEAIALTQCFWRYRGRAAMVFSLHSFDEFLVSARHRHGGFRRWMSAAGPGNLTTVVRLPAVNYGGAGSSEDSPLIQQFRRHTGRLFLGEVGNPKYLQPAHVWGEATARGVGMGETVFSLLELLLTEDSFPRYWHIVGANPDHVLSVPFAQKTPFLC